MVGGAEDGWAGWTVRSRMKDPEITPLVDSYEGAGEGDVGREEVETLS